VIKRFFVLALLFLILTGCDQLPPESSDQDALATAVSATLDAAPDDSSSDTPIPEATETSPASPIAENLTFTDLTMQDYLLAYTNDGNLWTLTPDGTAQQLSTSGDVVDVLVSDDRSLIVYNRLSLQSNLFEVRAVQADGSNDRQIISQDMLDNLYPLDGALHYIPSQMEFIPGTHSLLLNTRAVFDGPGLVKNDDLYRIDVDSGQLSQLVARERGGDFFISPNSQKLAISQADSIAMASIDGSNLRPDLVTFQPITTYSEYQYYPVLVWSPDSTHVGALIPSPDPLAENPSGTVWILSVDGTPQSFSPIQGDAFFPQSNDRSLLSPDMQTTAFLRKGNQGEADSLFLSNADGSNSRIYEKGNIQWLGWTSTGDHFAFRHDENELFLGTPGGTPQRLADGRSIRWLTNEIFVVQSGQRGEWTLTLGHIDGTRKELIRPTGDVLVYDLR
jgi:hypothetical protein